MRFNYGYYPNTRRHDIAAYSLHRDTAELFRPTRRTRGGPDAHCDNISMRDSIRKFKDFSKCRAERWRRDLLRNEHGVAATEYGFLVSLGAVVLLGVLPVVSSATCGVFQATEARLLGASSNRCEPIFYPGLRPDSDPEQHNGDLLNEAGGSESTVEHNVANEDHTPGRPR